MSPTLHTRDLSVLAVALTGKMVFTSRLPSQTHSEQDTPGQRAGRAEEPQASFHLPGACWVRGGVWDSPSWVPAHPRPPGQQRRVRLDLGLCRWGGRGSPSYQPSALGGFPGELPVPHPQHLAGGARAQREVFLLVLLRGVCCGWSKGPRQPRAPTEFSSYGAPSPGAPAALRPARSPAQVWALLGVATGGRDPEALVLCPWWPSAGPPGPCCPGKARTPPGSPEGPQVTWPCRALPNSRRSEGLGAPGWLSGLPGPALVPGP